MAALQRTRLVGQGPRLSGFGRPSNLCHNSHLARRRRQSTLRNPRLQFDWAEAISESEWRVYQAAIQALRGAGIRFMVGGGFALATFTGKWRDTKDIDFYVMPGDAPAARKALELAGFTDYYEQLAYDRKWIYRNVQDGVI